MIRANVNLDFFLVFSLLFWFVFSFFAHSETLPIDLNHRWKERGGYTSLGEGQLKEMKISR